MTEPPDGLDLAEYEALLRADFAGFAERCFVELNPQTDFATNWHVPVIAAKLTAVYQGRSRRVIINLPPKEPNPLKFLSLGGHGWKIGWKILFIPCSHHSCPLDVPHAIEQQRASWSMSSGCIAPWWQTTNARHGGADAPGRRRRLSPR